MIDRTIKRRSGVPFEVFVQRLLPIFIASVIAFYVTLLVAQAVVDGGQLKPLHYAAIGGVTVVTALLTAVGRRPSLTPVAVGARELPDRIGAKSRYLCDSCGKPIKSQGWRCENCGATRKAWNMTPGMLSARARNHVVVTEPVVSTSRELVVFAGTNGARKRLAVYARAMAFVARQSGTPVESAGDLLKQLRADPELIRRLYWSAAKRLHPDHNAGQHLPEWFELQQAVAVLAANPYFLAVARTARPTRRAARSA